MSLTQITYLPINSGLGDTAPAAAAKINAAFVETDTAYANANAALAAAGAGTTALAATVIQGGQISTLQGQVGLTTAAGALPALITTVAGLGGAQKVIAVSAQAGVDKTGTTSSLAAWNTIVATAVANVAAGIPTTILVDCKILLSIGSTAANTLFHPANVNIEGTPDGMLITDQLACPFYFFCNVSNIKWRSVRVRYIQPLNGSFMINQNVSGPGTWSTIAGSFQTQYLGGVGGYLNAVDGVNYANGANPAWNGPGALTALFNIRGNCSNIVFEDCTFDVPAGANPAGFIFNCFQYCSEYLPNQTVTNFENITGGAVWSAGTATFTTSSSYLSAYTVGQTNVFTISGWAPTGWAGTYLFTIASATTFTTTAITSNPGAFVGGSAWNSGTTYTSGQIVNYLGVTYSAKNVGGNVGQTPPNTTYWNVSYAVFGSSTTSTLSAAFPSVTHLNCTFDGVLMGHVGNCQHNMSNCTFVRYSDLQDGTNGVITWSPAPTAGATSATLAVNWPYLTTQYWITLNTGQVLGMNFTAGSTTVSGFVDPISGASSAIVGTMVFASAPLNGATSGNISGWILGRGTFNVVFSNGDSRVVTVANGGVTTSFAALTSGNCPSATQTLTLTTAATSGNVGGLGGPGSQGYILGFSYSAPPHAAYMGTNNNAFPGAFVNYFDNLDLGVRVFNTPTSRSLENSGNCCSLKVEIGCNSVIDNWVSWRPDGGMDIQSKGGTLGGTIRNSTVYWNSDTPQLDFANNTGTTLPGGSGAGIPIFGIRHPGDHPYFNYIMSNVAAYDSNPSPIALGFTIALIPPNQNLSVTGIKIYLNDWGGSASPVFAAAGTNVQLEASIYFNSMSTTSTNIGNVYGNSAYAQNCDIYIKYYGWRAVAITLASALTTGVTSLAAGGSSISTAANTVGAYPSGWPFATGVYKCFFYDNSYRYVTLTNGLSTMTWTGQGNVGGNWQAGSDTYSPQTTGITVQDLYNQNFGGYKPRLNLPISSTGAFNNTRVRVDDYSNQYFQDAIDNVISEQYGNSQICIPLAGTTSFTTNLVIPGSFYLTLLGIGTCTALGTTGGLTGYTVGWSGSLAQYTCTSVSRYAQPTTFNSSTLATIANAATGTTRTLIITAVGGTFDGTGAIQIAFRAAGSSLGF